MPQNRLVGAVQQEYVVHAAGGDAVLIADVDVVEALEHAGSRGGVQRPVLLLLFGLEAGEHSRALTPNE